MAGHGPAPKPASERARRNADPAPAVFVEADGALHGPDLPASVAFVIGAGDDVEVLRDWPAATVAWWDDWRRSPQASTFTATDWSFLADTALLHGYFWYGQTKHAAELRLRVAKFGATIEDRARLRIGIGKPATNTEPAKPKPAAQVGRRERILSVVEDAG